MSKGLRGARAVLGPVFCAVLAVVIAHMHTGCKPIQTAASPEEVNAAYTAETLHCVQKARTKEDSQTCRAGVNARYGLCDTGKRQPGIPCPQGK